MCGRGVRVRWETPGVDQKRDERVAVRMRWGAPVLSLVRRGRWMHVGAGRVEELEVALRAGLGRERAGWGHNGRGPSSFGT